MEKRIVAVTTRSKYMRNSEFSAIRENFLFHIHHKITTLIPVKNIAMATTHSIVDDPNPAIDMLLVLNPPEETEVNEWHRPSKIVIPEIANATHVPSVNRTYSFASRSKVSETFWEVNDFAKATSNSSALPASGRATKTIISAPIPPNHCVRERNRRTLFPKDSGTTFVRDVVERPETDSRSAPSKLEETPNER
tara:strand:- start:78 stop:659 length:582 start_codon:yes stop_codon:yes gene_type:complete